MPAAAAPFDRGEGTTGMETIEHIAARPSWDCRVCGDPWPCEPARKELVASHTRTELAVQMWVYFDAAAREMPQALAVDMLHRFLDWTWQAHPNHRD